MSHHLTNKRMLVLISVSFLMFCGLFASLGNPTFGANMSDTESNLDPSVVIDNTSEPESMIIEGTPVFTPSATGDDYIDGVYSITHGSHTNAPPSGMGVDSTSYTSLIEGEFGWANLLTQETFTSTPSGWSASEITYSSNRFRNSISGLFGHLQCDDVDTTHFAEVRFILNLGLFEAGGQILVSISFYDSSGTWNVIQTYGNDVSSDITVSSTATEYQHSQFKVRVSYARDSEMGNGFSATNWRITGYCENGAFRAVYSFTGLDYNSYNVEELYVDFATITSSEYLDFRFGPGDPSPDNTIRSNENGDFSVNIHSLLTESVCFLEIRDTDHTESDFDTWRINRIYIKLTNTAPYTDQTPSCSNMDDYDNLYGRYRYYKIATSFVDVDGFANIDHVSVSCYNDDRNVKYWEVRYTEDTHTLIELDNAANHILLDAATSTIIKSGTHLDVTFSILINWAHPSINTLDLRCQVVDDDSGSDDDYYEVNWEIETRLDFTDFDLVDDSGSPDRGDINGDITASGTLVYYQTSTHPPEDQVDVYVSCPNVATSPWEATNYIDSDGSFDITVQADDEVGSQTYSFVVVDEGAGAGGTNLLHASHTHAYISDRIIVTSMYTDSGDRVNIADSVSIFCELEYEYNGDPVNTGTVLIEGVSADWEEGGIWSITNTEGFVVNRTYDEVTHTGGDMGVTEINQNSQSTSVVWDRIIVTGYATNDSRVDISTQAFVNVTLEYEYDSTPVTDGIVEVNGIIATYLENGIWQFTPVNNSVMDFTYSSVVCSSNEHGLTTVNTNSQDITIIWDRINVIGYTADDTRVDVSVTINLNVTLEYQYDNSPVTDGEVSINGVFASYLTDGIWHFSFTGHIVTGFTWQMVECSGNDYDISTVDNSESITTIWDRVIVTSMYSEDVDNRTNVLDATFIYCSLRYEYDNSYVDSGSVTINGYTAFDGYNGIWEISISGASVGTTTFDMVTASGGTNDITVVNQNSKEVTMIWDGVEIYNLGAPSWALINESFDIWFNARLAYDNHPLGSGDTIVIDNEVATWNGTHFIITRSYDTSGQRIFFVNSTTEASFDIIAITETQSISVHITNEPSISYMGTDFAANDALYIGILDMTPLWFQWDPVNDPSQPIFSFTVAGMDISSWSITSSWSASVVLSGSTAGEYEYQIESGLDYSLENHTYFIHIESEGGYTANYTVYVTVRDYTQPAVSHPEDFTYELGSIGNNITWTISDANPDVFDVVGNGTDDILDFEWTWINGDITIDVDDLSPGIYNFTIVIMDDYLHETIDTVLVTIEDTIDPEVSQPADITLTVGATGISIYWSGSDLAPESYEILLDGSVVKSGSWNTTAETLAFSLDGLVVGEYTVLVRLFDSSGNSVSDTVTVTVDAEATTPTDTTPTDTSSTNTTDTGASDGDPMTIVIIIIGAGGAIIIIVVIIIIQKKKA